MAEDKYIRKVQTAVNNFIYCGDEYLFLKRNLQKRIDPGKLNCVGGRVEPTENFLAASIRETEEETGYIVTEQDTRFCGLVKLEGGYDEDWVMAVFKTVVNDKNIPLGNQTADGELIWIHKDNILDGKYELVDDTRYFMQEVIAGSELFFITAQVDAAQKVTSAATSKLKL